MSATGSRGQKISIAEVGHDARRLFALALRHAHANGRAALRVSRAPLRILVGEPLFGSLQQIAECDAGLAPQQLDAPALMFEPDQ